MAGRDELRQAHADGQLDLTAYWVTGAAWSDADAILVGTDFDFSMAMLADWGAGVAAAKRSQACAAAARQVGALGDLGIESALLRAVDAEPRLCERLSGTTIRGTPLTPSPAAPAVRKQPPRHRRARS